MLEFASQSIAFAGASERTIAGVHVTASYGVAGPLHIFHWLKKCSKQAGKIPRDYVL